MEERHQYYRNYYRNHPQSWDKEKAKRWRDAHKAEYRTYKKRYEQLVNESWGKTGLKFQGAGEGARKWGTLAEKYAISIMPSLGFMEIEDYCDRTSQFFIDFIATYKGQRVLVDATLKHNAYIPKKIKLARDLRMPLYILFISPNLNHHHLRLVEAYHHSTIKLPMAVVMKYKEEE